MFKNIYVLIVINIKRALINDYVIHLNSYQVQSIREMRY